MCRKLKERERERNRKRERERASPQDLSSTILLYQAESKSRANLVI